MSLWRRSQYPKQSSSTTDDEDEAESTSAKISSKNKTHHPANKRFFLLLLGITILFAVGIQLQHFPASLYSTEGVIPTDQDTSHSHFHWISSSIVTPSISDGNPSTTSTLSINESSWNEWESRFYTNNTILLEQLQKSSVYRSTDPLIQQCDKDCSRDYAKVSQPALDVLPTDNCNWPERMQELEYPWKSAQFSSSKCPLVHFSPTQACQILQERTRYGNHGSLILLFVGDSLIRQILVGLGIVLSGNHQNGGLQYIHPHAEYDMSAVWNKVCWCDNQYVCATLKQEEMGRFAHVFRHKEGAFRNLDDLCAFSSEAARISYQIIFEQQNSSPMLSPMIKQLIKNHPHHQFVIVTDASAFHSGLNHRKTRRFLKKLDTKVQKNNSTSLLIPMTVHFVGKNKPHEYAETQGRQPVEDYNQQLRQMGLHHDNYKVLDTYQMTREMPSQDGTHYPMASVALAQILLHYIRDYVTTS